MDVEKEITRLKYHVSLLATMANHDEYPFFRWVVDHGVIEPQTNTLLRVLAILNKRRTNSLTKHRNEHDRNYFEITLQENKLRFLEYGISADDLYQDTLPTFQEFSKYAQHVLGQIDPEELLHAIQEQQIHTELCEYLLANRTEEQNRPY